MPSSVLILKSQMLHYFIVMFKKRNIKIDLSIFFSTPVLTRCELIRRRRYIYLYYLYLSAGHMYFPFYIYNTIYNNLYIEDYYMLRFFDYAFKTPRISFQYFRRFMYQRTSKYFLPKIFQIFPYDIFNIRVYWFGYLSLGKYLEYFRYFKYLEYLKRIPNNISYKAKDLFRGRHLYDISLVNKYKLTVFQHKYIYFNKANHRMKFVFKFLSYDVKLLTKKLSFSLTFWASSVFYKFIMILFNKFNNFSFVWFTHRVWFCFKFRLTEYAKFRSLFPRFWCSSLKNLKFSFTKWFFRYFIKRAYIFKDTFFISISKNISLFYTSNLVLFDLTQKVNYHRVLLQLDRDI